MLSSLGETLTQHRQEQNDRKRNNLKRQTAITVCLYYLNEFYYFRSFATELVSSSIALLNSSCAFKIHCGKISIVVFQLLPSCCMVKNIRLPLSSGTFTLNTFPEGFVRVKLNSLFLSPALIILEKWMLIFTLIA